MTSSPTVHFRSVAVLLDRFPALTNVDLDVHAGEIILLQGPNGAGKSTLIRTCAGLLPISSGVANVFGRDLTKDRRAIRRDIGLVGHADCLYDDLTVLENIEFSIRAVRSENSNAALAAKHFDIENLLRRRVGLLSAGQRKRAALAILAATAPKLWLLDEAHADLDNANHERLDELIRQAASAGKAIFMVSHDGERAGALADRTITIAGGRVEGSAPDMGAISGLSKEAIGVA